MAHIKFSAWKIEPGSTLIESTQTSLEVLNWTPKILIIYWNLIKVGESVKGIKPMEKWKNSKNTVTDDLERIQKHCVLAGSWLFILLNAVWKYMAICYCSNKGKNLPLHINHLWSFENEICWYCKSIHQERPKYMRV